MANGKTKTIAAIITCSILVALTWTGIVVFGGDVKNTAEYAKGAVVELKKDGCDPVQDVDKRCLVLEIQWKTINTSQQTLEAGQKEILKRLPK